MTESPSYKTALKSTSLIGGASLINIVISMLRMKFAAVLLGPAGIGLIGIYGSLTGLVSTLVGMGIATSGTRQIAQAHGAGNQEQLARTVITLRRTVWLTGCLGLMIMVLGCALFSHASFGASDHAVAIAVLGVCILLANITAGQSCILQGTRRIGDLARVGILGALNGTLISIPCYYFWGINGIVPSLVLVGAAALTTAWWFARKVPLVPVKLLWRESAQGAGKLLQFGLPVMFAGFMTSLSGYLIPMLLLRQVGLDGVGIWKAAFNLSGILVDFVLAAMGTDYYPRLTAVSGDTQQMTRTVNEQTDIALLLAVPCLAATIIFAPLVIEIFYSGKFSGAVDILRWSVFGVFGKLVSWPLAYVLLAKGMGKTYFCLEAMASVVYVGALWLCVSVWGLPGAGMAYVVVFVAYTVAQYCVAHVCARTAWSAAIKGHIAVFAGVLAIVGLISAFVANPWVQFPLNLVLLAAVSSYCIHRLSSKSGITLRTLRQRFQSK